MSLRLFVILIIFTTAVNLHAQKRVPFRNPSLSIDQRVKDLLQTLTLEEKISLLGYQSKAVPRLGIPAYNWWNEALHGVARAGNATVFPQAIGMAASFDEQLLYELATAISTEARAKFQLAKKRGLLEQYMGLTFWSPNINIFRDPRWGRGQETYGEDPFLTGTMGSAFIRGIQGNDPLHLKAAACAKHFAVHSGPEAERHSFNAIVSETDLRETYLYAFRKLVDAGVESVMCAYNRVNGEPCCTGQALLQNILKKEWGFKGHVVTDCFALQDVYMGHKVLPNAVEVAAAAIKAGVSLDCSNLLQDDVMNAVKQHLLTEKEINQSLSKTLATEIKLGFFDEENNSPYAHFGADSIANDYHRSLARKMATESMVLLKNDQHILPLDKNKYPSMMLVGPNAANLDALLGNYHGVTDKAVNFVEGITAAAGPDTRIEYDMGCDYQDTTRFGGIWAAGNADITIAFIGLTPVYEGEEGDAFLASGGADRKNLELPAAHIAYIKALRKGTKTPLIVVITGGSALDIAAITPYADAIIFAWYPGQEGGNALADLLFGKTSPSGHLPVSFYNSLKDLPPYRDYAMQGRTYRYFKGRVQYPFGYGLSYTEFSYAWSRQPVVEKDSVYFSANIRNIGSYDGDELAQVYVHYPPGPGFPLKELKAFKRIHLQANESGNLYFAIPLSEFKKWDVQKKSWTLFPGNYEIVLGSHSEDERLTATIRLN